MMIVSLIPFVVGLIGYDVCVKDSPEIWKNGPEYTFRIRVNASLSYPKARDDAFSNLTLIVKCRPFATKLKENEDGLQCHVNDALKQNYDMIQSTKLPKIHADRPATPFNIGNQIFEILYNEEGVRELRVEVPVLNWRMNMFRSIASHLNFGFQGIEKNEDSFSFQARENSTIGNCETKIELSKKVKFKSEEWSSSCGDKIRIEMLAFGDKYPLVVVNKTRDIAKCSKYTPYLFGDDKEKIGYDIKMTSSSSGFALAPRSFGSHTIDEGVLTYTNVHRSSPTMEHIDLRLISIEPAIEELKRLVNPGITSIFSGDEIVQSFSKKTSIK